jgi:hypothetical protein
MAESDGWEYQNKPDGGDCRKIVTLDQGGMCWVGIRAYNATTGQWLNGGEPERASVLAWKDLDQPARGRWVNGRLVLGRREFSLEGTGFTLKVCGCSIGLCDGSGRKDGTCRESVPVSSYDPAGE